jgi:hypothetical protein
MAPPIAAVHFSRQQNFLSTAKRRRVPNPPVVRRTARQTSWLAPPHPGRATRLRLTDRKTGPAGPPQADAKTAN